VCARAGVDVVVRERDAAAVEAGMARIFKSLERAVKAGKLSDVDMAATKSRLRFTTEVEEFADRQMVIEAIAEDQELKTSLFADLDRVVSDPDAVFASNTSSIPIMKLGISTKRPKNVVGLHFFNPVPVLNLVEVVPSLMTSPETIAKAEAFATDTLHKVTIRSQDRAGFVVNALLIPFILSAIRMLESGFASANDIDEGMVRGCSHPMGPLRLADLIGLDTTMAVAESLYAEFKEPLYAPPPMLARMCEAGLLGRKTGRGFYDYS
jgi:3-hydroxybutyryl-CoA dehydrogenase